MALPDKTGHLLNQQSAAALIARRLSGVLPHIDIAGSDFTIDWRVQELRETESPWNKIDLTNMEMTESTEEYIFFYDLQKRAVYELADDLTEIPENVVLIEMPNEYTLDPVAAARAHGLDDDYFFEEHPIQAKLIADVKQLSDTWVPAFVNENLENSRFIRRKNGR